jgi:hypothetical protein
MGYYTYFIGELLFKTPLTNEQKQYLKQFLGLDIRNKPELHKKYPNIYHIDYMFNSDETGIEWNECEKSYYMGEAADLITKEMRAKWPDFQLIGQLEAFGEEQGDRWRMVIDPETGMSRSIDYPKVGHDIACPNCGKTFKLDIQE